MSTPQMKQNRKTVLRYVLVGGVAFALVVGAAWFLLVDDEDDARSEREAALTRAGTADGAGDADFSPAVQAGLTTYSECLEELYRANLRRKADFDHAEAARAYVERWSLVIQSQSEERQLGAINRELVNYNCDPL